MRISELPSIDDFYNKLVAKFPGLTINHLRYANFDKMEEETVIKCLDKLLNKHHLTPAAAIAEMNGLSDPQAYCLSWGYERGLRGEHLRDWQKASPGIEFTSEHSNALYFRFGLIQHNRPHDAVKALRGVKSFPHEQMAEFVETALENKPQSFASAVGLYANNIKSGVRNSPSAIAFHNYFFNHPQHHVNLDNETRGAAVPHSAWNEDDVTVAIKLMIRLVRVHNLTPQAAIAEIHGLNDWQAHALYDLFQHGLRGEHLRQWNKRNPDIKFTEAHRDALLARVTPNHIRALDFEKEVEKLAVNVARDTVPKRRC